MLKLTASAAQGSRAGSSPAPPWLEKPPHKADPVVVSSTCRGTQTAASSTSLLHRLCLTVPQHMGTLQQSPLLLREPTLCWWGKQAALRLEQGQEVSGNWGRWQWCFYSRFSTSYHQRGILSTAECQSAPTGGSFLRSPPTAWEEGRKPLRIWPSAQSCSLAYNFLQFPATKPLLLTADFNYCFPAVRVTCNLICVSVSLMLVFVSSFVSDLSKMFR